MPIYEQKCKKCFARFEVMVSFADAKKAVPCIECGSPSTVRLISKSSFALKGDGWAKDGYSSSGTKE